MLRRFSFGVSLVASAIVFGLVRRDDLAKAVLFSGSAALLLAAWPDLPLVVRRFLLTAACFLGALVTGFAALFTTLGFLMLATIRFLYQVESAAGPSYGIALLGLGIAPAWYATWYMIRLQRRIP